MPNLKDILEELARHTYSDKYISKAQSQIEKWIEECIPEKKEIPSSLSSFSNHIEIHRAEGFNEAIDVWKRLSGGL